MFNLIPYVLYVSAFPTIILLGLLVPDDSGAKSRFYHNILVHNYFETIIFRFSISGFSFDLHISTLSGHYRFSRPMKQPLITNHIRIFNSLPMFMSRKY